jgi:outer membrane murein-binding lipoprotein Lpp
MVWDELLSVSRTALSFGSKIKNWVLSSVDNKVLISTDVQDLSATLSINTKAIAGSVTAATNLASSANTISNGTVDNTAFTATTTELESNNITDSETNLHKGRSIVFKTGHLAKEYANITAYSLVSGRGHFTYTLLSSAPSNADTFEVF